MSNRMQLDFYGQGSGEVLLEKEGGFAATRLLASATSLDQLYTGSFDEHHLARLHIIPGGQPVDV